MRLKKLKKRMTKAQLERRDKKIYDRKHHFNMTQDKDKAPTYPDFKKFLLR